MDDGEPHPARPPRPGRRPGLRPGWRGTGRRRGLSGCTSGPCAAARLFGAVRFSQPPTHRFLGAYWVLGFVWGPAVSHTHTPQPFRELTLREGKGLN